MSLYECVFIVSQDLSTGDADKLADVFADVVSAEGGKVVKRENWGLRQLAYRIQKNRKGHYVLFDVDAPFAAIQEMERQMRINENILRYMTVKVDAFEEGPSVMMAKPHDYRDDTDNFDYANDYFVDGASVQDNSVKLEREEENDK